MFSFLNKRKKTVYILNLLKELKKRDIPLLDINISLKKQEQLARVSNSLNGYFSGFDNMIAINQALSLEEIPKVLYHEYGHAIDLFIGLHHNPIVKEENYFYSNIYELSDNTLHILKTYLSKKHSSKKSLQYYMEKNEYFAELFSYYQIEKQLMPLELKNIVEDYLKLFTIYYNGYSEDMINYYNSYNLKYRDSVPLLNEMVHIKKSLRKDELKFKELIKRVEEQQVNM